MSFIFIVVLKTQKRLTPKDVAAVKGCYYHERIYTLKLIVSTGHSQYIFSIYRGVKDMEKFDA
jgi:hypothetical protein